MQDIQKLLCILLSLLAAPWALADDAPWYEFEVIVFEYLNRDNLATETWPADPGMPVLTNAVPLEKSGRKATLTAGNTPPTPFMMIPAKDMQLAKDAERISRSKTRRVLLHTGWLQPVYAKEKAIPVYFKAGEEYPAALAPAMGNTAPDFNSATPVTAGTLPALTTPASPATPIMLPQLEGTLSVSVGRYLHIWTDLLFRRREEAPLLNADGSVQAQLRSYRFIDHRRMRSKEIHYIDNPAFGIIILATPYDEKAKSEAATVQ